MKKKIRILIGDESPDYGMKVADQLRKAGFFAYTRKKDGNIILNSIIDDRPNIVIMDWAIVNIDAISIMKRIKKVGAISTSFIITSKFENNFVEKYAMENGASYFIIRPFDCEYLASIINYIIQDNEKTDSRDIETVVTDIIHKMGIPAHIKGYNYLRTAILSSVKNRSLLDCVTGELYPAIAKAHDTTATSVERAIRHAIEIAWNRGNTEMINSFLGQNMDIYKSKPTNSEFIAFVTDKLRIKYRNFNKT